MRAFPTRAQIERAWHEMGFDPGAPDSPPTCDKCGAPIESGAIALSCPWERNCAMTTPEDYDHFIAVFGGKP